MPNVVPGLKKGDWVRLSSLNLQSSWLRMNDWSCDTDTSLSPCNQNQGLVVRNPKSQFCGLALNITSSILNSEVKWTKFRKFKSILGWDSVKVKHSFFIWKCSIPKFDCLVAGNGQRCGESLFNSSCQKWKYTWSLGVSSMKFCSNGSHRPYLLNQVWLSAGVMIVKVNHCAS